MSASFGIHFGSSSACLAVCGDGKTTVVANDVGNRTTPAIVSFTDHDQAIGLPAKQGMIRNAANTVCDVKRMLGKSFDDADVQSAVSDGPVKILNKDGHVRYEVEYKEKKTTFTPVQIATVIYKKMMETAESHGGIADSHDAVITVPLDFTEAQKEAITEAATKAGFRVLRVISEPSAAVLAYDIGQNKHTSSNENMLVYRIGGSSMDVTVITVSNGMYKVVASTRERDIGGHLMDDILIDHFAGEFKRQWKCDCKENKRSVMKLRNSSEICKHVLSTMDTTQCSVESLYEGIDFQATLSRSRLEGLCGPFLQKCLRPVQATLNDAGLTKEDIDKVIVCGGTAKVPSLQRQLRDMFPHAEVLSSIPPDEVIAVGAAKEAAILSGLDESILQRNEKEINVPSLPVDILIQTGDEYVTVLHKETPVPVRSHQNIQLGEEQTSIFLQAMCRTCPEDSPKPLAKVFLRDLPAGSMVTAVFHVKGDGSMSITCSEGTTNKSQHVFIESS